METHSLVEGSAAFRRREALSRREVLQAGGLGLLGLTLPALLKAQSQSSGYAGEQPAARARSCIFVFLSGGPSQYETFDPKPLARADYRTIFGTISTSVPGTQLCEYLPGLAQQADKFALIRSAYHRFGGHFGGHRYALTGYPAPGNADQPARADDKPGLVAVAGKFMSAQSHMPVNVMAPWIATDQGSGASGGMGGGALGRQFDPILVEADQSTLNRPGVMPVFRVPAFALQPGMTPERLDQRQELLSMIDAQREVLGETANQEINGFYQSAYSLLTAPQVRDAFDLEREDVRLRDNYGRDAFGQSCLLGRRLIEAGVRFVQVNFSRNVTQTGYGWDTHNAGRNTLQNQLLPKLNAGLSALLADLDDRGLLQETLVVAMGEFGRTPRVKTDGGRDHWPQCYSLLLAGGGVHGGLVYGRSDRDGAQPAEDPVEARQILVSIMELLGIPTVQTDVQGRTAPVLDGAQAIRRLFT
jgi:hypothetical protein